MATAAERLLRLMVPTREPETEYALNDLAEIDETKAARPARISVRAEPDGWRAEAAQEREP